MKVSFHPAEPWRRDYTKQEVLGRTNRRLSFDTTRRTLKEKNWVGVGGTDAQTHRQQGDLISLLLYFQIMEIN
jgi:hypothetical protein